LSKDSWKTLYRFIPDGVAVHGRWVSSLAVGLFVLSSSPWAMAHGDLIERIARLNLLIEQQPGEAALHFELADVYCQHADWRLALEEIEQVKRLGAEGLPTDLLRGQGRGEVVRL